MPISRRPKDSETPQPAAVNVDALILKGGSVAGTAATADAPNEKGKNASPVVLRVPTVLMKRVDQALEGRPVKIPRHTWLLEAVVEKLEREGDGHDQEGLVPLDRETHPLRSGDASP